LNNLREVHRRHELNYEAVVEELDQSKKELQEGETCAPEMAQRYKYYQELRGYVTDLVECLDEKVGLQIKKETAMFMKQQTLFQKGHMFDKYEFKFKFKNSYTFCIESFLMKMKHFLLCILFLFLFFYLYILYF
jgi:hypothetical protein